MFRLFGINNKERISKGKCIHLLLQKINIKSEFLEKLMYTLNDELFLR